MAEQRLQSKFTDMNSIILASISDEAGNLLRDVTVEDYTAMLTSNPPAKQKIAEMIYHRLYGRYIKPFLFNDDQYKKHYKHGFSMMASACLLVEALESFYQGLEVSPRGKNKQMFVSFFKRETAFRNLNGGEFYDHVRCGILHQAETTGGFTISRDEEDSLFDSSTKRINAHKFLVCLKESLKRYEKLLLESTWDSEIWDNFRRKMRFIIDNCAKP